MIAFRMELFKMRRKRFPLIVLGMMALECLWMTWGTRNMNASELAQGYKSFFYQFPLLNAIVLPVLVSILVSRLCDMEHKGDTFKLLWTMERAGSLFDAKLLCTLLYLAAAVGMQMGFIRLYGQLRGFMDLPPAPEWINFFASQLLTSLFLILAVQTLALKQINQFIPLVMGLCLGFLGLMSLFFPAVVARFVPSAYYGLLSTARMNWDQASRAVDYYFVDRISVLDYLLILSATVALYLFGRGRFVKKEV